MVIEPLREPLAVGVKVTLIVQEALGARFEPQVFVSEKSPLAVILLMVRVPFPVLLRVTLCGLLLVPTGCAANVIEPGERLATGAAPVPARLTV